jgi:hypothetical protein
LANDRVSSENGVDKKGVFAPGLVLCVGKATRQQHAQLAKFLPAIQKLFKTSGVCRESVWVKFCVLTSKCSEPFVKKGFQTDREMKPF